MPSNDPDHRNRTNAVKATERPRGCLSQCRHASVGVFVHACLCVNITCGKLLLACVAQCNIDHLPPSCHARVLTNTRTHDTGKAHVCFCNHLNQNAALPRHRFHMINVYNKVFAGTHKYTRTRVRAHTYTHTRTRTQTHTQSKTSTTRPPPPHLCVENIHLFTRGRGGVKRADATQTFSTRDR